MSGPLPDLDEPISFAVDNGAQAGPYPMRAIIESIRNGERAVNTLVWWAGEADWVAFDSVPGLVELLQPPAPADQPPPPADDESTPLAADTVTVGDPAPGDLTDVWRDVPGEDLADTEVVTSEELAADFGSVVDSGSGLFETTPTDAFEDVSAGMPDDADGVGESLGEAFETLDSSSADVIDDAELVESVADEAIITEDLGDGAETPSDADDSLIVAEAEGDDDGFAFTREHDFFDPATEEAEPPEGDTDFEGDTAADDDMASDDMAFDDDLAAEEDSAAADDSGSDEAGVVDDGDDVADHEDDDVDDQPPAPADDAQPTSLQSVSERIEALGAESRAAIGGAGVLGSGQRLFSAITDEPELDPEAPIDADRTDADADAAFDDSLDDAEAFDDAAGAAIDDDEERQPDEADDAVEDIEDVEDAHDEAAEDADDTEGELDEADHEPAFDDSAEDQDDAEVDAALDELDDIAEEAEIVTDEPDVVPDEHGAPDENADLESHFGHLREAAASLESERSWAASLDDVMLSVIVGRALDAGYSVVDLRSLSPNHIARFERSADAARLIVALDQLGPVATETQLSGHHTSMLMSWGRPVDADRLPESEDDSDAGQIGVHGDAESGYAYTDVELIVPLNDYVDADFALDDDSVGHDFDAAHHGLQREWYDRFG